MPLVHTSTWKHLGIALLTLFGMSLSAAAMWALYGNALIPVERILPDDTALLVSNTNAIERRLAQTWIPGLNALPDVPENATIAIIPDGNTMQAAILTPSRSPWRNAYDIVTTSDGLKAKMGLMPGTTKPEHTLEKNDAYKLLVGEKSQGMPWIYLNPRQLTGTQLSPFGWLTVSSPVAIAMEQGAISISIADSAASTALPTLATNIPQAFAVPSFTIRGTDLPQLLKTAEGSVSPGLSIVVQSKLTQLVQDTLGRELSMSYDLLPLFSGASTLVLGKEVPDGPTHFLAEGIMDKRDGENLDRIIESFRLAVPTFRRENLTFKDGFASDTLATEESTLDEQKRSSDGWTIRTLKQKDANAVLHVATRDEAFILSDSEVAVNAWISQSLPPIRISGLNGTFVAGGLLSRMQTDALLATLLGSAWDTQATMPSFFGDTLTFTLTRQRKRLTLRVENAEKATSDAR